MTLEQRLGWLLVFYGFYYSQRDVKMIADAFFAKQQKLRKVAKPCIIVIRLQDDVKLKSNHCLHLLCNNSQKQDGHRHYNLKASFYSPAKNRHDLCSCVNLKNRTHPSHQRGVCSLIPQLQNKRKLLNDRRQLRHLQATRISATFSYFLVLTASYYPIFGYSNQE